VTADSVYSRSHAFRWWQEEHGRAYALMVLNTHAVRYEGRRQPVAKLATRLSGDAWKSVTVGVGTLSANMQVWACLALSEVGAPEMRRWLLIRRSGDDGQDLAYFLAHGTENTTEAKGSVDRHAARRPRGETDRYAAAGAPHCRLADPASLAIEPFCLVATAYKPVGAFSSGDVFARS
jgi:hypothetical protein